MNRATICVETHTVTTKIHKPPSPEWLMSSYMYPYNVGKLTLPAMSCRMVKEMLAWTVFSQARPMEDTKPRAKVEYCEEGQLRVLLVTENDQKSTFILLIW